MRAGRAALRDSKAHPPRFAQRLRRKGRHGLPGKPDSRHRGLLPHRWGKPVTNRSNPLGDALGIAGEAKRSPRAYALTIASIATRRVLIAGSPPWGRRLVRRRQIDRTEGRVHIGGAQFVGDRPRGEMRKPGRLFISLAVAVQHWWRDYAAAGMSGVGAGGSHAPVVNSWVIASRVSMPHLVAVDR